MSARPKGPVWSAANSASNQDSSFSDYIPGVWYVEYSQRSSIDLILYIFNATPSDVIPIQIHCTPAGAWQTNVTVNNLLSQTYAFYVSIPVQVNCAALSQFYFEKITFSNGTNTTITYGGVDEGYPQRGLLGIPIVTVFGTNVSDIQASEFNFTLGNLGQLSLEYLNQTYTVNSDGTLNPGTLNFTVSEITWVPRNLYLTNNQKDDVYSVPWWSRLLYSIGMSRGSNYFVYPGSENWNRYLVETGIASAPILLLALLVFLTYLKMLYKQIRRMKCPCGNRSRWDDTVRDQAKTIQRRIREDRHKLDHLMATSEPRLKFIVGFFLVILTVVIPFIGYQVKLSVNVSIDFKRDIELTTTQFETASSNAVQEYTIIETFYTCMQTNAPSSEVTSLLQKELVLQGTLVNLTYPGNFPIGVSGLVTEGLVRAFVATSVSVICVFVFVYMTIALSLCLTCYTCTWGSERVIFGRMSTLLGGSLSLIIRTCLLVTLIILAVMVYTLTLMADLCFEPNMIVANPTSSNWTDSQDSQRINMIYLYRYVSHVVGSVHSNPYEYYFNIAAFLSTCKYTQTTFNPYDTTILLALDFHNNILRSINNGTFAIPAACTSVLGPYSDEQFYFSSINMVNCEAFLPLATSLNNMCTYSGGEFSKERAMFVGFCLSVIASILLALTYLFHRTLRPSLYRVKRSQTLVKVITMNQEELQKLVRTITR